VKIRANPRESADYLGNTINGLLCPVGCIALPSGSPIPVGIGFSAGGSLFSCLITGFFIELTAGFMETGFTFGLIAGFAAGFLADLTAVLAAGFLADLTADFVAVLAGDFLADLAVVLAGVFFVVFVGGFLAVFAAAFAGGFLAGFAAGFAFFAAGFFTVLAALFLVELLLIIDTPSMDYKIL